MSVHIVQLLCPSRHCLTAGAYNDTENTKEVVIEEMKKRLAELKLDPWCWICKSRDIRYEDLDLGFATMEEATPWLMETQAKNMLTRAIVEAEREAAKERAKN